jgi:hypothetical protein
MTKAVCAQKQKTSFRRRKSFYKQKNRVYLSRKGSGFGTFFDLWSKGCRRVIEPGL